MKVRGGSGMKVINPVGKSVSNYAEAKLELEACMCVMSLSFASAQGIADVCAHCGCNCLPHNFEANYNAAYNANYRS